MRQSGYFAYIANPRPERGFRPVMQLLNPSFALLTWRGGWVAETGGAVIFRR
jgi:hypothetical protein